MSSFCRQLSIYQHIFHSDKILAFWAARQRAKIYVLPRVSLPDKKIYSKFVRFYTKFSAHFQVFRLDRIPASKSDRRHKKFYTPHLIVYLKEFPLQ